MPGADRSEPKAATPQWLHEAAARLIPAATEWARPGAGEPALASWEWRVTVSSALAGVESVLEDGGARAERFRGPGAPLAAACFLVGGEPDDLLALCSTAPSRDYGEPLHSRARRLALSLADQETTWLRELFRRQPAPAGMLRFRLWCRLRAIAREPGGPYAELAAGLRLELDRQHGDPAVLWLGAPPSRSSAGEAISERAGRASRPASRAVGPPLPARDVSGARLLLRPSAAAWWVHEMGHAALESPAAATGSGGPGGWVIVDDPLAAPWPAGFERDDLAQPSTRAVLWDGSGCHAPPATGRRRRPSVRQAAVPALSATRLEAVSGDDAAVGEAAGDGLPTVEAVRAARFDPATRRVYLRIRRTGGRTVDGVAVFRADQGWQGLQVLGASDRPPEDLAACSRQGGLNAVMVGAPTLSLEAEQVRWASPPPSGGNRRKIAVTKAPGPTGAKGNVGASTPSARGGPALSHVDSEWTKASVYAEVRVDRDGSALTRGCEQGGWAPEPLSAPDRPAAQLLSRLQRDGAPAGGSRLLTALTAGAPPPWSARLAAVVGSARVAESPRGSAPFGPEAADHRQLLSGAVEAVGPSDLVVWSRVTPLSGDAWPPGWVEAVHRQLEVFPAQREPEPEPGELRALPTVVDVFALCDLLRWAARDWLAGHLPVGSRVAAERVLLVDRSPGASGGGAAGEAVVRRGRLVRGTDRAPVVRSSWRERPAPGWWQLMLGFEGVSRADWPDRAALVTRVDRIGDLAFASGGILEAGRIGRSWGPLPVPGPAWWLLQLSSPCGPVVPDGTGPPVGAPACRLDGSPFPRSGPSVLT